MKGFSRPVAVGILFVCSMMCSTLCAELAWNTLNQSFQPAAGVATVAADFRFENRGRAPVTIKDITTSCGCVSTKVDKTTYAPGETGALHVVFNTAGKSGRQSKIIRVTTDDPNQATTSLRLDIGLSPSYVVTPRLIRWKHDEKPDPKNAHLRLAPEAGFHAPTVTDIPNGFTVKLDCDPSEPGNYLMVVAPTIPTAQRETITIELTGGDGSKVSAQLLVVVE